MSNILMSNFLDMAEAFIFDAGWIFFAAWGVVLAAVSVIAFGRDMLSFKQRQAIKKNPPQS
jgi:hypothetical protein